MTEKQLMVHADDVGMCHSVNTATARAFHEALVTCGSVMVPCAWVPEAVTRFPEADLGVHLTLNSEWKGYRWGPVSPSEAVSGLLDPQGYMWPTVEEVVSYATPKEVEREIRAQVQRALDLGLKPTHLDTHMGTLYASPDFFEVYIKVAREFNISPMIPSPESQVAQERMKAQPEVTRALLEKIQDVSDEFPLLDELVMGVEAVALGPRKEAFRRIISGLKPGTTQIIVHLGFDSEELKAITSSEPAPYAWQARWNDFQIFTDPEMKMFIKEQGIQLVGWREFTSR